MEEFDVVVIGSGSGGYVSAIRAADLGLKVAIVESRDIGGVCLNRGCIPTKALLRSAELYHLANREFGGKISYDIKEIQRRKALIVRKLGSGIQFLLKKRGILIKRGDGRLLDEHTIEIDVKEKEKEKILAKNIVIATGSEPLPILNIDRKNVLTSDEVLELEVLPKSMLIVGAGAIGIEFATFFSTFGTKVTLIELMDQVLPALKDDKITGILAGNLRKLGIEIKTGIKIENIEVKGEGGVISTLSNGEEIMTEKVLVSVGRRLNSDKIGLEELGVKIEDGRILVNSHMRTNLPNIYAIGDVVGGNLLAHKAMKEGIVAAEAISNLDSKIDYRVLPWVVFSRPEIASVGLTESEAIDMGIETVTGEFSFSANGKALCMGDAEGEVKIVGDRRTEEIIGGQIVGPGASELISELTMAVENRISVRDMGNLIHVHPTLSEALMEAYRDAIGDGIHKIRFR